MSSYPRRQSGYTSVDVSTLQGQAEDLRTKEADLLRQIKDFNNLWESRRFPLDQELELVRKDIDQVDVELQKAVKVAEEGDMPLAPGPALLSFVDGMLFGVACNFVVALNLGAMVMAPRHPDMEVLFKVADQVFMVWYVFELIVRAAYHRTNLYCGKISVVWWNWLDLIIVISGVVDQWLVPLIMKFAGSGPMFNSSALRSLRLLRLFRVMRALKLIKALLMGDLNWTQEPPFEIFMSSVIAMNAIVMSLELDVDWAGWQWVENAFLVIYTFELAVRMKRHGCTFFTDTSSLVWNCLDLLMVVGGILDLWLLPLMSLIRYEFGYKDVGSKSSSSANIMSLLKLMRIVRVLRLVRLFKAIRPLYTLLLGVIESLKAMQWVMVLTLLMLYAGAIFWTSLVGKGLITGGKVEGQGIENFSSVSKSLFSLFRLMNGDTDVVEAVTNTVFGQLMFAAFMVLSNWAILAILTSVVSDNMISASTKAMQEDMENERASLYAQRASRLRTLFKSIDKDQSGTISEGEWNAMLQDSGLFHELSDITALGKRELRDVFTCLAVNMKDLKKSSTLAAENNLDLQDLEKKMLHDPDARFLFCDTFIDHLKDDGAPVDKRCVLHLQAQLQGMERYVERRFDEIWFCMQGAGGVGAGGEEKGKDLDEPCLTSEVTPPLSLELYLRKRIDELFAALTAEADRGGVTKPGSIVAACPRSTFDIKKGKGLHALRLDPSPRRPYCERSLL